MGRAVRAEGLPNLYRVDSEVYRSGQPEGEGLRSAENLGIKTVPVPALPQQGCRPGQKRDLLLRNVPMHSWNTHDEDIISALRIIHGAPSPSWCTVGTVRTGRA